MWGKYGSDASMIGEHKSANPITRLQVRTSPRHRNLNARRPPRDKRRKPSFTDTQERFMDFGGIGLALDDV